MRKLSNIQNHIGEFTLHSNWALFSLFLTIFSFFILSSDSRRHLLLFQYAFWFRCYILPDLPSLYSNTAINKPRKLYNVRLWCIDLPTEIILLAKVYPGLFSVCLFYSLNTANNLGYKNDQHMSLHFFHAIRYISLYPQMIVWNTMGHAVSYVRRVFLRVLYMPEFYPDPVVCILGLT